MKKFGVGEVILDEEDQQSIDKTASTESREKSLAEVREEQQREAEQEK